jgi:hypothetical protein
MLTIIDILENAEYNFKNKYTTPVANNQLRNAITLLEKGYSAFNDVSEIFDKYPNLNDAPNKDAAGNPI